MIVLIRKNGQTCNRLFQYAHLLAYSRENKVELFNPTFHDLKKYFILDGGKKNTSIFSMLGVLFRSILCIFERRILSIDSPEKCALAMELMRKKDYLVWGWCFRDQANFLKHADELRRFFTIKSELTGKMAAEFENKRKEADIIIGVHIRRGDYKVWAGGKYYYEDETYISFIRQMSNLIQHKRILFVVCSNEELDRAKYEAIESDSLRLWFPKQDFINELYLLSKCDRIIGPPSTYSHWASFYGNVPCLHLTERSHVIELSGFEVCSG